jgi:hypothetical protein
MSSTGGRVFGRTYEKAFSAYLADPAERPLRAAYELGRDALLEGLSLLELAAAHHEALLAATRRAANHDEADRMTRLAADFLAETLSAYEMAWRGFEEAVGAAEAERRQATLVRSLSSLLTDTSLALDGRESLEEMLRLVAEQASELTAAACCVVTIHAHAGRRPITITSDSEEAAAGWADTVEAGGLARTYDLMRNAGGAARLGPEEVQGIPAFSALARPDRPPGGWVGVRLTALDGSELGFIQLFGRPGVVFSALEADVIVQLAQMTSAALERATHYARK